MQCAVEGRGGMENRKSKARKIAWAKSRGTYIFTLNSLNLIAQGTGRVAGYWAGELLDFQARI